MTPKWKRPLNKALMKEVAQKVVSISLEFNIGRMLGGRRGHLSGGTT